MKNLTDQQVKDILESLVEIEKIVKDDLKEKKLKTTTSEE